MLPTALVPVRIAPTAKGRLAHVLSGAERMRLISSLFEHVTSVLDDAGLRIVVVTPTPAEVPSSLEVWTDEAPGLNGALQAALQRLALPVLIVHADLPLLRSDDVDGLLANDSDVVVARAHDGGTNGLLLRRPLTPAFGADSALVHAARARAAGLSVSVVDIPGFAQDVDTQPALIASGLSSSFRGTRP
jgi:2-phospho-L-lactate/phosphoenolpyruvate guanylyltransferase